MVITFTEIAGSSFGEHAGGLDGPTKVRGGGCGAVVGSGDDCGGLVAGEQRSKKLPQLQNYGGV